MVVKVRRAAKLSGGSIDNAEVETLRRVARSVRGEEERDGEAEVRKVRKCLDALFSNLKDPSLPPVNPVRALREALGISRAEMATTCHYSYTRWCGIEDGGISVLPNSFLKIAVDLFGASAAADFEKSWNRYRASLSDEDRQAVERKLFPFFGSGSMAP